MALADRGHVSGVAGGLPSRASPRTRSQHLKASDAIERAVDSHKVRAAELSSQRLPESAPALKRWCGFIATPELKRRDDADRAQCEYVVAVDRAALRATCRRSIRATTTCTPPPSTTPTTTPIRPINAVVMARSMRGRLYVDDRLAT